MVEILQYTPRRNQRKNSVFVLNVYSNPRHRHQQLKTLLERAVELAGPRPLVIVSDFNAPRCLWGYVYETRKGSDLWQDATELDLTLITDKALPTRIGNSATRDTTPDLAFIKKVEKTTWANTAKDFGSDHYDLQTSIIVDRSKGREFTVVDWDLFRSIRGTRASAPDNFEEWCEGICRDTTAATEKINTYSNVEKTDSRLAHLREAKTALFSRWKKQRHNHRLRERISKLNKEIEQHCDTLCKQQCDELCESVDGQIKNGKSWHFLKHLLDEQSTRVNKRHILAHALHEATKEQGVDELVTRLVCKYLPVKRQDEDGVFPEYGGPPLPELDKDFSEAEIRRVIQMLNRKSAPGPDGITDRNLRNFDDASIERLTGFINEAWKTGRVPEEWKLADTILIPKPSKSPSVEILRPIFLTSCVGKVAEHAILYKLNYYLEGN
ncbi:uncharacterized protein LOC142791818 [Rhipicephalus microplus]|uniref:uncharacterized protein LOC142791818 n=1 Tax=Rhipicephalus microplus TaxID=6941 RepID=UPI003F6C4FAB